MNDKERLDLAEWAMQRALKSGATEVAVELVSTRNVDVEVRDGNLDKLADARQTGLDIDVYVDGRFSTNSTDDLRKPELEKFIDDAVAGARYLAPDVFRALPDPRYYPEDTGGDLKTFDPAYEKIETEDRVKLARELEAAVRASAAEAGGADKVVSTSGSYSDAHTELVRVHSNGFVGGARGTRFDTSADVTVQDASGGRPDDWCGATTRHRRDLPDPIDMGQEAVRRALGKLGQRKIASGRYACLVEARAGRRLVRILQEPLGGRALQQKSSFLEGMMHKQVGSANLTLTDDPTLERGLASRLFDGEGLAAKVMPVFDGGILMNYYIDAYYARKMGAEPTTGWASNVVVKPGTRSLEAIIKDIDRGILVQGFIGGNSNSTTGDFSMGVMGQLVESGQIVAAVNEMNISGNTRDFFMSLVEVGNDPYLYSSVMTPSLLFEGVHFSGI